MQIVQHLEKEVWFGCHEENFQKYYQYISFETADTKKCQNIRSCIREIEKILSFLCMYFLEATFRESNGVEVVKVMASRFSETFLEN